MEVVNRGGLEGRSVISVSSIAMMKRSQVKGRSDIRPFDVAEQFVHRYRRRALLFASVRRRL